MKKTKLFLVAILPAIFLLLVACTAPTTDEKSKEAGAHAAKETIFTQAQTQAQVERLFKIHAELVEIAKTDELAKNVLLVGESYSGEYFEQDIFTKDGINLRDSYAGIALPINYFFDCVNLGADHFDFKEYAASMDAEQLMTAYFPSIEEYPKMEKTSSTDYPLCEAIGLVNYMNRDGYTFNNLKAATEPIIYGFDTAFTMTMDVGTNKEELVAIFNAEGYLLNIIAVNDPDFDKEKYVASF